MLMLPRNGGIGQEPVRVMAEIAMDLKCAVCAAEDQANSGALSRLNINIDGGPGGCGREAR